MPWLLSDIRKKVRDLTGRPTAYQMTDVVLDSYINNYYEYTLPDELDPAELLHWFTLVTASGQGAYTVDPKMISLKPPVTIDDSEIDYYTDDGLFFSLFPRDNEGATTYDEPTAILLFDSVVYLRPIPDDAYTLRVKSKNRPDVLVNDTDEPRDSKWGPLIAYGAAIDIHMDDGETDEANDKIPYYRALVDGCNRKNLYNWMDLRSIPSF